MLPKLASQSYSNGLGNLGNPWSNKEVQASFTCSLVTPLGSTVATWFVTVITPEAVSATADACAIPVMVKVSCKVSSALE